jgi:hypothetical protein
MLVHHSQIFTIAKDPNASVSTQCRHQPRSSAVLSFYRPLFLAPLFPPSSLSGTPFSAVLSFWHPFFRRPFFPAPPFSAALSFCRPLFSPSSLSITHSLSFRPKRQLTHHVIHGPAQWRNLSRLRLPCDTSPVATERISRLPNLCRNLLREPQVPVKPPGGSRRLPRPAAIHQPVPGGYCHQVPRLTTE